MESDCLKTRLRIIAASLVMIEPSEGKAEVLRQLDRVMYSIGEIAFKLSQCIAKEEKK